LIELELIQMLGSLTEVLVPVPPAAKLWDIKKESGIFVCLFVCFCFFFLFFCLLSAYREDWGDVVDKVLA